MRRLIAASLALTLQFAPGLASAGCPWNCPPPMPWLPDYSQSSVQSLMRVVGFDDGGQLDPAGAFTVVLRDLASNPVPGAVVTFDFSACGPATICAVASNTCDSLALSAPDPRAYVLTGADGSATVRFAGTANNPGGRPATGDGRVRIYACGWLIATVPAAFLDMDGGDGMGATDLSAWLGDFFSTATHPRGDYDGSGALGANDLSAWLQLVGSGDSALGCANHP